MYHSGESRALGPVCQKEGTNKQTKKNPRNTQQQNPQTLDIYLSRIIPIYLCMYVGLPATACMWRSEDNLQELVLFFPSPRGSLEPNPDEQAPQQEPFPMSHVITPRYLLFLLPQS